MPQSMPDNKKTSYGILISLGYFYGFAYTDVLSFLIVTTKSNLVHIDIIVSHGSLYIPALPLPSLLLYIEDITCKFSHLFCLSSFSKSIIHIYYHIPHNIYSVTNLSMVSTSFSS